MAVVKELRTPEVMTVFPYLFTKTKVAKDDPKLGYSATLLFEKSNPEHKKWLAELRQAYYEMMKEAFPYLDQEELKLWAVGKPTNIVQEQLAKPFSLIKDGDAYNEKSGGKYPYFVGMKSIQVRSTDRHDKNTGELVSPALAPRVVNAQVQDILDPSEVYGGCYGKFYIKLRTYGGRQGKEAAKYSAGIAAYLLGFQKTKDGERIGGGGPIDPKSVFDPVVVTEESDYGDVSGETTDESFFDE